MAEKVISKPKNNMTMTIVIAVVVAALAFFGGMQYQKSQAKTSFAGSQFGQAGAGGANGQRGGRAGGRGFGGATVGDIVSVDANSITVKLQDGSSKIVNLSGSTTFSKTDTASKSDLKTGIKVAAFGTPSSDGSITAQNVQLNPMFRVGPRPSGQPNPGQ